MGWLCACAGSESSLPPAIVAEVDGKEMVLIPAGEFIMGTDKVDSEETHKRIGAVKPLYLDQRPERKVYLDAYYIDRYEVTNREYQRFLQETQFNQFPANWEDEQYPEGEGDHPVAHITWYEALIYALWAHKKLPTEAQWEKAARGPDGRPYPWGDQFEKGVANVGVDGPRQSRPGGEFPKDVSVYQVYDMAGNVMEWTADWYQPYPGSDYKHSRFGKKFKVIRGNGFHKAGHYFLDAYRYAFYRTESEPEGFFENVGFRCVTPVAARK